jgi:citrate lyase subunit beta / citryl-CoA lyase
MSAITARPRRSVLYMPGANAKALEKARTLPADALILDLEDAVAPETKAEARDAVASAVSAKGYGAREVVVRVNGLTTSWGADDIRAAVSAGPDAVLVPKISSAADVSAASAALDAAGAAGSMALWVMIETPASILAVADIAAAAGSTRLAAFVMGTNDLAKETRARITADRLPFAFALAAAVTAARAHGLAVIDGVYNDIADTDGFEAVCRQGVDFGFDGKTLIHPSQLEPCNRIFAPAASEVEQARAVIAAFDDPQNAGKGVLKVNGRMTELLHRDMALQTVAIADAITALEAAS